MSQQLSPGARKLLRRASLLVGALLLAAALLADVLGFSVGAGFSRNQVTMFILGAGLLAGGILDSRFASLYRSFAVLLLNLIVIFLIADLGALVLVKILDPQRFSIRQRKIAEGNLEDQLYSAGALFQ